MAEKDKNQDVAVVQSKLRQQPDLSVLLGSLKCVQEWLSEKLWTKEWDKISQQTCQIEPKL